MIINVKNTDLDIGKRLDLYLSLKIHQLSRSAIKKVIESNEVRVNGEVCYKAGYKISENDEIDFPDNKIESFFHLSALTASEFDLEVILEDEDYLFINKPIGLTVHPTRIGETNTLVNKLISLNKDLPSNHFLRPGIVHRLDKDTSGIIVVAKNPKSLWWLSQKFAERKVKKEYISIGINHDSNFSLEHEFIFEGYLRRSSSDRKEFIVEKSKPGVEFKGRFSKSDFKIEKVIKYKDKNIIFSKIYPHTGRTHQIRVHQKYSNFTIIKDKIYMSRKEIKWSQDFFLKTKIKDRLYLHSNKIAFENYDGKMYSVESKIPDEFEHFLEYVEKAKNT